MYALVASPSQQTNQQFSTDYQSLSNDGLQNPSDTTKRNKFLPITIGICAPIIVAVALLVRFKVATLPQLATIALVITLACSILFVLYTIFVAALFCYSFSKVDFNDGQ